MTWNMNVYGTYYTSNRVDSFKHPNHNIMIGTKDINTLKYDSTLLVMKRHLLFNMKLDVAVLKVFIVIIENIGCECIMLDVNTATHVYR